MHKRYNTILNSQKHFNPRLLKQRTSTASANNQMNQTVEEIKTRD